MVNLFGYAIKRRFISGLSAILLSFSLASCSDTDGPPEDLFGTAATGAAMHGTVYVIDAEGAEISKPINTDGSFRFDVRGMTAPFMLKSVASDGIDPDLYSFAEEANVTANITPLTNVAMFIANGNADPAVLYDSWASAFGNVTATIVDDAQATVNANLGTQYVAFSLVPQTYDFIATRFLTNSTSIDALLDAMIVDISSGTIDISVTGLGALVFDTGIDITGFDIGGDSVAEVGNYTLSMAVTVADVSTVSVLLSINLPASELPTDVDSQVVEDMFVTFYSSVGSIVVNSVVVTVAVDVDTLVETTEAGLDTTITTVDGDVNYIATYTYTQNQ